MKEFFDEIEELEIVAEYSPKNFCELILFRQVHSPSELRPEKLESFFISWSNRIPQKSLTLIVSNPFGY